MRRRSFAMRMAALSAAACWTSAQAQDAWPGRPIRIVVPLAPGGGTDALARIVAQKLSTRLGQPVVVENRPGAAGNIGAEQVFRAPADGYTLLFTQPGPLAVNKALYPKMSFDPERFVPIALVSLQDIMLAVNPRVAAGNLQELIAYAKAHPGKLNYGSSGAGSAPHLAAELFKSMAKVDMVHVPYKGSGESMRATIGGQVDLTFFAFSSALPHAKSGKLRAIAVAGRTRNPALPNVPAIGEVLPGYVASSWTALVAPPDTPPDIARKLQEAVDEVKKEPDVQQRMIDAGDQVFDSGSPQQMAGFLSQETQRWGGLIKTVGIKVE